MQRKIRVLVGKPGLDGHDRGAKVVAAALRDAGMEVIYTGLHQMPEQIVEAALQEDVDVVALSILSGAHMTLFPEVQRLMQERGIGDKLLSGGGIIPPDDIETLSRMGVGRLFGPGASTQDIVAYLREWFAEKHGAESLTPLPPPPPPAQIHAIPMPFEARPTSAAPARRAARPARTPTAPRKAAKKKAARSAAKKSARPARKTARAAGKRAQPKAKARPRRGAAKAKTRRAAAKPRARGRVASGR